MAIAASTLAILEVGKLNLALPALSRSIGAGPSAQQLVISAYALGFALALVPAGRAGDVWSRRGVLTLGLAGLGVSSLVAALAPGPEVLIVCRALQGISAGLLLPQTAGILQDLFTGASLARAYGGFGAVVGVSAMVGPALGGLFLGLLGDDWGWRVNLLLNVPVVVILLAAVRAVPPNAVRAASWSLDLVGLALLAVAITTAMLPFAGVLPGGATGSPGITSGAVALLSGLLFWRWELSLERRGGAPMVAPRLWRRTTFTSGVLVGALFFVATAGGALVGPLFLQSEVGLSPLHVALLALGSSAASAVSAWRGAAVSATSGRAVVAAGLAITAVGTALTALACLAAAEWRGLAWLTLPAQAVMGLGAGLVTAPNQALSMVGVPREDGSVAGSVFQVGQRVGTALGITASLGLFYGVGSQQVGLVAASAFVVATLCCALGVCAWERRAVRRSPPVGPTPDVGRRAALACSPWLRRWSTRT